MHSTDLDILLQLRPGSERNVPPAPTAVRNSFVSIAATFHVERGFCRRIVRSSPALARHDVSADHSDQWCLGSGRLVRAVALFCFAQKRGQRHDVRAEPSSRKPRLDLLEEPAVTVGSE